MSQRRIDEVLASHENTTVSFEFFPPKTPAGMEKLKKRLELFREQDPVFVDFTWGAGGSTSALTMDLSAEAAAMGINVNMHLTCTNMPESLVHEALACARKHGIVNIVALRGDPPSGQDRWVVSEGGFSCALDLVKFIRTESKEHFGISVAGYPEGHPEVIKEVDSSKVHGLSEAEKGRLVKMEDKVFVCSDEDFQAELAYLKKKVDAGANVIITQMFFDTKVFLTFVEACRRIGISVPIVPGIMLISSLAGFNKMTAFCKTRVPDELRSKLDSIKDDAEAVKRFGIEFTTNLCKQLLDAGIRNLHFYTLNTEEATFAVLKNLNLLKT